MKKKIKIKIKINVKIKNVDKNTKLQNIIKNFKIPLKKVAIELNEEIVDKKKLNKISLKTNNKIEIINLNVNN